MNSTRTFKITFRLEIREDIELGMAPQAARHVALRKFGSITRVQEDPSSIWRVVWFEQFMQDTFYSLRTLRRQPGFTIAVVATLALGIGRSLRASI